MIQICEERRFFYWMIVIKVENSCEVFDTFLVILVPKIIMEESTTSDVEIKASSPSPKTVIHRASEGKSEKPIYLRDRGIGKRNLN